MTLKAKKKRSEAPGSAEDFWDLTLYVIDRTPRSNLAIKNLKGICEGYLKGRHRIKVIDIMKKPEIAFKDRIVAVPLVARKFPPKRIIGDLSQKERVLSGLDIVPEAR